MNISNMPAAVQSRPVVVAPAAKKRTGLIPMAAESQHNITVSIDGAEQTVVCTARHREDVPRAKARIICLHERCRGKDWPTVEAMTDAHPQPRDMAKRDEIHVYGMWSDDPQAEGPAKAAAQAIKDTEEQIAAAKAAIKAAKGVGERELARDDLAQANTALLAAQQEHGRVSGVVGLIAPPGRGEE